MRESSICTNSVVNLNGQWLPECMVRLINASQADRNFFNCQTYNLGIYDVCNKCQLECEKNKNFNNQSFNFIMKGLASLTGLNLEDKALESINSLDSEEFKPIKNVLDEFAILLKDLVDGRVNQPDLFKKKIEGQSDLLKEYLQNMLKQGHINSEDLKKAETEVMSMPNLVDLKNLVKNLKINRKV